MIDPRDPPKPQVITGGAEFKPWEDDGPYGSPMDGFARQVSGARDQARESSSFDWPETPLRSRLSATTDGNGLGLGRAGESDVLRLREDQRDLAISSPFATDPKTEQRTQYGPAGASGSTDEEPQLNRPRLAQAAAEVRRTIEREDAAERHMQARAGEAAAEEARRLTAPSGRELADILDDLGRSNALDKDVDELRHLRLEALANPEDENAQLRFENKKLKLAEKIRNQLPVVAARYGIDTAVGLLIGLLPGGIPTTAARAVYALARGVGSSVTVNNLIDTVLDSTLEHAIKQPPKPADRKRTPDEATRALAESGRYGVYRERESPEQRAYDQIFKRTD